VGETEFPTLWEVRVKLKEKDSIITKQQKEFDERSKWALELDQKVKEKDSIITKQQKELNERSK